MAAVNLDVMFEKAKAAYPEPYREGDMIWELVDGFVATKNYAFDGQLMLQSRQEKNGQTISKTAYSKYRVDEEEME
ncbi:MAG: hypothetical protein H6632_08770 [Anaerolineales bacterium]|nr:hypothetical protein [Anaerolineales bacterium]